MKISSYNINDVAYHYIGIRVLAGLSTESASRAEQISAISRNAYKYVSDRALRLMLPEPRGTFETIGEKICHELQQMRFAKSQRGGAYDLTDSGQHVVKLLEDRRYPELRQLMIAAHLGTYDNLRMVLDKHLDLGALLRPILEAGTPLSGPALRAVLLPVFGSGTNEVCRPLAEQVAELSGKKAEDAILTRFLTYYFHKDAMGIPLFRALCDRLISLRLINMMRVSIGNHEFYKSYSIATRSSPGEAWYIRVTATTLDGDGYDVYISEPDTSLRDVQERLLSSIHWAFENLQAEAGYFDLPDVRDLVCEKLHIPEASFDEGTNRLLDWNPSPLTVAFRYERISARRKPLARSTESTQLYNMLRGS